RAPGLSGAAGRPARADGAAVRGERPVGETRRAGVAYPACERVVLVPEFRRRGRLAARLPVQRPPACPVMKFLSLLLAAAFSFVVAAPAVAGPQPKDRPVYSATVSGMTCLQCKRFVKQSFAKLQGVDEATFTF